MYFFLESIVLFVKFNLMIIVFGSLFYNQIILRLFPKAFEKSSSFLLKLLYGHSLGLALYIIISYFFILVWEFNQFTGYYFYLIFIVILLCISSFDFLLKQEYVSYKEIFIKFRSKFIQYFKRNRFTLIFLLFSSVALIYFFYIKTWWRISLIPSHYAVDGYFWEGHTYYLLKYNTLNVDQLKQYPGGFPIYAAGMLLPQSAITVKEIHFFLKILPCLILIFNLILFTIVGMYVFRKRIYALIASFSLFSYGYFMYRSLMALPTILCTTFFIYLFLIEFHSESNHNFSWILIGTLFLIHPIQFLLIFSCFSIYILLTHLKKNNLIGVLTFLFIVLIYSLIMRQYGYNWIGIYQGFFSLHISISPDFFLFKFVPLLIDGSILEDFFNNFPFLEDIVKHTSGILFILFCIVLLLPSTSKQNYKTKKFLKMLKIFSIIWLLIFLSKDLFSFMASPDSFFERLFQSSMFNIYIYRIKELISIPMAFLIAYGFQEIITFCEKILKRIYLFICNYHVPIKVASWLKMIQNWNVTNKIRKNRFKFIPFCLNVLILFLFLNINLNKIIIQEYRISEDHTNYTFPLRESEEEYFQNYGKYATIYYSDESSQDEILLKYLFTFDHTLQPFDESWSDVNFLGYIQNLSSGDVVVLSRPAQKYYFIKYNVNYSSFAIDLYENYNVLILRIS